MKTPDNKYSMPVGTLRYRVEYVDHAEAVRLAAADGWKEGESLWDYIDPIANDARFYRVFKTLDGAVKYAKTIRARDVYESPRVDEIELQEEWIEGAPFRDWEITQHWLIEDGELVLDA
jgi:hypothetical protein